MKLRSASSRSSCITKISPRHFRGTRFQSRLLELDFSRKMQRQTAMNWTKEAQYALAVLLLVEVRSGHRVGNKLTDEATNRVLDQFNAQRISNVPLNEKKLKDKWSNSKSCCQVLNNWLYKETGLGYDASTGKVDAPKHFWERVEKGAGETVKKAITTLKNGNFYCGDMWNEILQGLISSGGEHWNAYGANVEQPREQPDNAEEVQQTQLNQAGGSGSSRKRRSAAEGSGGSKRRPVGDSQTTVESLCAFADEWREMSHDAIVAKAFKLLLETPGLEFNTDMHAHAIRLSDL